MEHIITAEIVRFEDSADIIKIAIGGENILLKAKDAITFGEYLIRLGNKAGIR